MEFFWFVVQNIVTLWLNNPERVNCDRNKRCYYRGMQLMPAYLADNEEC